MSITVLLLLGGSPESLSILLKWKVPGPQSLRRFKFSSSTPLRLLHILFLPHTWWFKWAPGCQQWESCSGGQESWFLMELWEESGLSLPTSYSSKPSASYAATAVNPVRLVQAAMLVHVRLSSLTQHNNSAYLKAVKPSDISFIYYLAGKYLSAV